MDLELTASDGSDGCGWPAHLNIVASDARARTHVYDLMHAAECEV